MKIRGSFTHFLVIWANYLLSYDRYKQYEMNNQDSQKDDPNYLARQYINKSKMEKEKVYAKFLINEGIKYGFFIRDNGDAGRLHITSEKFSNLKKGFILKLTMESKKKSDFPKFSMFVGKKFPNGPPKNNRGWDWSKGGLVDEYVARINGSNFTGLNKIIRSEVVPIKLPFFKECEYCGDPFITLNNRQKYCFTECKQNAFMFRRLDNNHPEDVYCPICGEAFWSRAGKLTCGKARCKKALQRQKKRK